VDYRQGIFDMVACLKSLGHRKIAFLSGLPLQSGHPRYRYFTDALRKYGLAVEERLLVDGGGRTDEEAGRRAVDELLGRQAPFTAIFAVNDLMAIGAVRRLRELGRRVPEDVSVVGCDGIRIGTYMSPALSTIDSHGFQTGQAMMRALIEKMRPEKFQTHQARRVVRADFQNRETVAKAAEL